MRVISGTCRGKKLLSPPDMTTRPTSDRVKEALFNILTSHIDFADARVLDICAGTGSLGIEALSRGAQSCCFIECNPSVLSILGKNIHNTGNIERSIIFKMDAVKSLQLGVIRHKNYNLVFLDPPYSSDLYSQVLEALNTPGMLAANSVLVAECSVRNPLKESYGRLRHIDRRVYGETALELFLLEER